MLPARYFDTPVGRNLQAHQRGVMHWVGERGPEIMLKPTITVKEIDSGDRMVRKLVAALKPNPHLWPVHWNQSLGRPDGARICKRCEAKKGKR